MKKRFLSGFFICLSFFYLPHVFSGEENCVETTATNESIFQGTNILELAIVSSKFPNKIESPSGRGFYVILENRCPNTKLYGAIAIEDQNGGLEKDDLGYEEEGSEIVLAWYPMPEPTEEEIKKMESEKKLQRPELIQASLRRANRAMAFVPRVIPANIYIHAHALDRDLNYGRTKFFATPVKGKAEEYKYTAHPSTERCTVISAKVYCFAYFECD